MKSLPDDIRNAGPFRAFLDDMATLGVTPVTGGGEPYAVVAARSNQRWWLLPLDSRRAAMAGLEMLQPVTRTAQLAKQGARAIARHGPLGWLGRGHLRLSGRPNLAGAFGDAAAFVACFTGTEGPHRKTALQLMDAEGVILGYAKLTRASHIRPWLRNEAVMLRRVADMGLQSADVPAVKALRDDAVLTLLVTDSHKSATHAAPRRPSAAHMAFLAELRAKTGRVGAWAALNHLERRTAALAPLAGKDWTRRLEWVNAVLRPVAEAIPVCLAHGDFTPWNTFLQGGRLYVFDWEYATEARPVGFDLAHFLLSTIPPGAQPDSLPALTRALAQAHFDGAEVPAERALLLSLACHAMFYLDRLGESGNTLVAWADAPARASLIDRLLVDWTGGER